MIWLFTLLAAWGADRSFYPNASDHLVNLSDDMRLGTVPVRLTGALVVHADRPQDLAEIDGVVRVEVLAGGGHVARLIVEPAVDELALSRAIRERPDIRWAHPDFGLAFTVHALPDDPGAAEQWHLTNTGQRGQLPGTDINAEVAWTRTTGAGQLIAVIDSGVQLDHPDLDVIAGADLVDRDSDPTPVIGTEGAPHGTAAAGLIAAKGNNGIGVAGVAYDAQLYAIRIIGSEDSLSITYEAMVDAVDAGATVLNNSWGFGEGCPEIPSVGILEEAAAYVEEVGRGGLGAGLVVSAGNGNCDIQNDGWQEQPAVISVAAVDGRDRREDYSSFGAYLDISAPSGGLLTTDITGPDGYGSWNGDDAYDEEFSGTSAAAPLVAGTMALMFSVNDRLTAAQAREVLCDTAVRIDLDHAEYDASGWSPWYGCGRVDAGAAVLAVDNEAPTAPVARDVLALPFPWTTVELSWDASTDPDNDILTYIVEVWPQDSKPRKGERFEVQGTHLDVTDLVAKGELLNWRVTAVDLWGEGPVSETKLLIYPKTLQPSETTGCDHNPGRVGGLALLACVGLRRRQS